MTPSRGDARTVQMLDALYKELRAVGEKADRILHFISNTAQDVPGS